MPQDSRARVRAVRAVMAETGLPYTSAARLLDSRATDSEAARSEPEPGDLPGSDLEGLVGSVVSRMAPNLPGGLGKTSHPLARPQLLPAIESFLTDFFDLEEPLLIWLAQTTIDARQGADDVYELPAGLDGEAVRAAWARIFDALPEGLREERRALRTGRDAEGGNKVFGPGGYEYTPLYAAPVDQADVEVLAMLLGHLQKAVAGEAGHADLRSLLDDAAEWYADEVAEWENGYRVLPQGAEQVVSRLARVVDVFQRRDADTEELLRAVTAAGPDRRIVLTLVQEEALRRYFGRLITAATQGQSRLDQALARFVELGDF